MAFVSSLEVFYELHFLYLVFIMLYTEDFLVCAIMSGFCKSDHICDLRVVLVG